MLPHTMSNIQYKITICQKEQEKPAIRDIARSRNDPVARTTRYNFIVTILKDLVQKWTVCE